MLVVCIRITVIILLTVTAVTTALLYIVYGRTMSETPMRVHDLSEDRPVENTRVVSMERLSPENRSAVEYLSPNSRSMNVHPWASPGTRMPPTDDSDMSISKNRYPNNHRYDNSDDGVILDTQKNINR